MPATATRRSDGICLTLLLRISGTARDGKSFSAPAHTLMVSRSGAVIVSDRKLAEGDRIQVQRTAKDESRRRGMTRVLGQYGRQGDAFLYAIECLDNSVDLWGVDFPGVQESEEAVARVLLECAKCHTRELAYLDPIHLEHFETYQGLVRHCRTCGLPRVWLQASNEFPDAAVAEQHAKDASRAWTHDQSLRLKTQLTACVRQAGTDDELAVCEEVSNDGLSFRSRRRYEEGSEILVAAPYANLTENVFVPARVIYVETSRAAGFFSHQTAYAPVSVEETCEASPALQS
jgi:hypothetical protein